MKAWQNGYAVGAFNTVNIETTRGILEAARAMQSPVIIQMTEKSLDYAGARILFEVVRQTAAEEYPEIPLGIHLDHGKNFEIIERTVELGFPSVMYDGSRAAFADNLAMTKRVVDLCHAKGVMVQAELGSVPYLGEVAAGGEVDWEPYMTQPDQAQEFVEQTGLDVLAVAIGNAHGFVPERPTPDYTRLSAIRERVSVPIVMHGASDLDSTRVSEVIRRGVSCFNVDTATRMAFLQQLKTTLTTTEETDLRKVLGAARDAVRESVSEKMRLFGSASHWED